MNVRTVVGWVSLAVAVVALATLVYVLASSISGWRERQEQWALEADTSRAAHQARIVARVEECRSKGGVPITDGWSGWLIRCDFPSVQR